MTLVDTHVRPCAVAQTTIVVTDALDLSTVPATAVLFESVATTRPRRVVIDLARCPFADASAIAFLVRAHRRLRRNAGQLVVLSPRPVVKRVLRASRADEVLDVVDPERTANVNAPSTAGLARAGRHSVGHGESKT